MSLADRLLRQIGMTGPISVAHFMAIALHDPQHGYYATRRGIGEDFITGPRISQMFGEIIGAWCVHEWRALGAPSPFQLIELGPGDGGLMQDVLRAARVDAAFLNAARLVLVERSPGLRAAQAAALQNQAAFAYVERIEEAAAGPALIFANEFLDCFPIRQFVRDGGRWRERLIGAHPGEPRLIFALSPDALPNEEIIPAPLRGAPDGTIAEISPACAAFAETIAARLLRDPGRALFIDYGDAPGGDTLQAIRAHRKRDPLAAPGEDDLTAHVDFGAFAAAARAAGARVDGPVEQGAWLLGLGLQARAHSLARAHPERVEQLAREVARLTGADQMGSLFKVLCLSSPASPMPAGF